jgi:phage terminase large subunit
LSTLRIETPRVFAPLLKPARYKGAHGGRGSGKSHFFAEAAVERCVIDPAARVLCVREVQLSLKQSVKKLIEDKIRALRVRHLFEATREEIRTSGGGLIVFQGMQDHTAETVKSFEGFDVAWVEEAQSLSQTSLTLLRPTIRKPGSELWFSWNPRRRTDPVDKLLRGPTPPSGAVVVRANWSDNPWFPPELETERQDDQRDRLDQYEHVWEGDYVKVFEGAYFAKQLAEARKQNRVGNVSADPLMQIRAFWDLGVSDHTAIWIAQFVGREIRVLDYCEAQGQPLAYYANWLRTNGYGDALCVLPHDGAKRDGFTAVKFEDHLRDANFTVQTVQNQGRGAAMMRVEAARRLFPRIWFNEPKVGPGLEALGAYHERKDENRNIGLGPEHDWASHGADAFGLMCVAYEEPVTKSAEKPRVHVGAGGWMG